MGADRRLTVVFPGATSPPRDGASSFVRAVVELLVREGHDVNLVVPSFLEPVEPLERAYAAQTSRWLPISSPSPGLPARVRRAAAAVRRSCPAWVEAYARPDVVVEAGRSAEQGSVVIGFGAAASSILEQLDAPSLLLLFSLPLDDLVRSGGSSFDRRLTRRFQETLTRRHDLVAATTPSERGRLSTAGADAIWLPYPQQRNRADAPAPAGPRRLLFIADWNYPPNRLGLEFLLGVLPEIWRHHPETELVLAGKGSDELEGSDARVRRFGQYGELAEVADASTVAVLPLLAAGGVRTRLLELSAAGIPVVATLEATGGVDPGPGVAAVAPDRFAARLLEVLGSAEAEQELRRGALEGGGTWPAEAEVAVRWRSAIELAVSRHASSTRSSRPARSAP